MTMKELNKKEIEELVKLYEKERKTFTWLISFETFVKDYVVKCEVCGEFFATDCDETKCEECKLEERLENAYEEEPDDWDRDKYYEGR